MSKGLKVVLVLVSGAIGGYLGYHNHAEYLPLQGALIGSVGMMLTAAASLFI